MSDDSTPAGESTPELSPTDVTPEAIEATEESTTPEATEAEEGTEASTEETFAHTFNPHELPDELQPRYREMLADYTRKTQEVAAARHQLAEVVGGVEDLSTLRDARDLYEQLQDQTNWPQLYTHLQEALVDAGMLDGNAQPTLANAPADPAMDSALEGDPELAPINQTIQSLQSEIAQLREERDAEREADRAYQVQQQRAAYFAQQEAALLAANKHYGNDDIGEIRMLAAHFGGDRVQAQQVYEAQRQRHVAAYIAAKQAVQTNTPAPAPGAEVTGAPAQDDFGTDLDAAHAAGMAELRAALGE